MNCDRKELEKIDKSYKKLTGKILGLSEAVFKQDMSNDKWENYRKLLLDVVNNEARYLIADLEGRNYYKLEVRSGKNE